MATPGEAAQDGLHEGLNDGLSAQLDALRQAHDGLLHAVSHDLRAPLRHITSFAPLLRESVQALRAGTPGADTEAEQFLATMEQAARRMAGMIDALLLLSRVQRAPLNPGTIDLAAANDSTGQVEHAGHLVNLARLNSGRGSRTIISGCHIRTGRRLRRIVRAAGHLPRATAPSSHGIAAPPNHIHGRAYRRCHLHQRRARLLRRHGADRQ